MTNYIKKIYKCFDELTQIEIDIEDELMMLLREYNIEDEYLRTVIDYEDMELNICFSNCDLIFKFVEELNKIINGKPIIVFEDDEIIIKYYIDECGCDKKGD